MKSAALLVALALLGVPTLTQAQVAGPFAGSVVTGAVTADVQALSLADALSKGLQFNLGIVGVDQLVESARGSRMRTLRELMPRVDARIGDVRQTSNLAAFGFDTSLFPGIGPVVGPYSIFDARVSASQTVFDLSALRELRSKDASMDAARLDARNARDTVTFIVTSLYFQAVAGESRITTAKSQVATAEALLAQATSLRNAGVAPGVDVVRAQVQVQVQRQRLIAAENDFAKQCIQLQRAIGVPAGQRISLTDSSLSLPAAALSVDDAVQRALSTRPDYRAVQDRVKAAEAMLAATRADALPSLHVAGDIGTIGSNPGNARRTYAMSAAIRVPLFDQDRQGRLVENQAALKQRQAEAADLAQRIEADVRTAALDVRAAEQQVSVAHERAALASQELSLSRIRFTAGVTSNLEVIQAQNEVTTAAEAELGATYALNVAKAAFTRAVGGQ